jgi:hypothetical protein
MLEERSGIARQLKADLFVSIHADSAEVPDASGATLYTLSDRGSSEEASRIAARENRADTVNGVPLAGPAMRSAPFWSTCRSAMPRRNRRALPNWPCARAAAIDFRASPCNRRPLCAEIARCALGAVRGGLYLQRG